MIDGMLSMLSLRLQQQRLNIREVWTKRVCCKVSGREPALGFGLGDNEKFQARLKRALKAFHLVIII